jgi:hypothetical protein
LDIRKLKNWDEFELELLKVENLLQSYKQDEYGNAYVSDPLYRGQSKSSYKLSTTLDRYFNGPVSFEAYQRYLSAVKPAIESFTGTKFEFNFRNEADDSRILMGDVRLQIGQYEYMAYLRHHGFPSPLLDWSRSPYVALYFAYENADVTEDVAVYVYVEHLGGGKGGLVGSPQIHEFGHYVTAHRRHFLQQSQYTACIKKENGMWYYCPHEEAFSTAQTDQDLLIKLELPSSERDRTLLKLDSMNINAFSLFGSDEGLMKMLAFREKELLEL